MDTRPLLTAKSITLKIPPTFGDTANYQQWTVKYDSDISSRTFMNGLAGASADLTIPNSSETLSFVGTEALKWDEMLSRAVWHQPYEKCDLSISGVTVGPASRDVTINATSSNGPIQYSVWQSGVKLYDWQTSNEFIVSETGTLTAKTKDAVGCTAETQFSIASHLTFNGTDQYVDMGQIGGFWQYLGGGTFEFRIKTTTTINCWFGFVDALNFNTTLQIRFNEDFQGQIHVSIFTDDSGVNTGIKSDNPAPIFDGSPHRLSFVFDELNSKIFIDGSEIATTVTGNSTLTNLQPFSKSWNFGATNRTTGDGSINSYVQMEADDIRFWKAVRTQAEIDNLKNTELTAPNGWATDYPDLLTYFKCQDGAGDILTEEISGNDGALVGNVNDNMWVGDNL